MQETYLVLVQFGYKAFKHKAMKKFIILPMLTCSLMWGQQMQAQNEAGAGEESQKGNTAKVTMVKVIDGKTIVEEREIELENGSTMQVIELETGGAEEAQKIIRKFVEDKEEEIEIRVTGDGEEEIIVVNGNEIRQVGKGDQELVMVEKFVECKGEKEGKMQIRTVKVINGDTVLNDIREAGATELFLNETKNAKRKKGDRKRRKKKGAKEDVIIRVEVDSNDDNRLILKEGESVSIFVLDLDEKETARYAPNEDNSLEVENMSAYPNPNNGLFNLGFKLENTKIPAEISVSSLDGKVVYRETVQSQERYEKQIDLRKIPQGVYLLRIVQGEQTRVKKIVIE